MSDSNDYLLRQEILFKEPISNLVWEKTLLWIITNRWEIVDKINEKYVKFNHVISSVRSYIVRKIEITLTTNGEIDIINFNVFTNSKYPDRSNALQYKEVILDYLYFIEVSITEDILRVLFTLNDINRLIRGKVLGTFFIFLLTLILFSVAIEKAFLLGYLLGIVFFLLSIPSIKGSIRYIKLKKSLY